LNELSEATLISRTPLFAYVDWGAAAGINYYAVRPVQDGRGGPADFVEVHVPVPQPPPPPTRPVPLMSTGAIRIEWQPADSHLVRYHVYRRAAGESEFERITATGVSGNMYIDAHAKPETRYQYSVTAVSRRGVESERSPAVEVQCRVLKQPVFDLPLTEDFRATTYRGESVPGHAHGQVRITPQGADCGQSGHLTYPHDACFDVQQPITVTCRVRFDQLGNMPVILSCGAWNQAGWFLQRFGQGWRWYIGGISCDGGEAESDKWYLLAATFDGQTARLYENGRLVGVRTGGQPLGSWRGPLHVGQYSAQPGSPYQMEGKIQGVRIFHRVLSAQEISELAAQ
jgi:hypothetical protein